MAGEFQGRYLVLYEQEEATVLDLLGAGEPVFCGTPEEATEFVVISHALLAAPAVEVAS